MIPEGKNRLLPVPISNNSEADELAMDVSGIAALLPRYYEAVGDDITYEIIERFDVDGHEVAWLEYTGKAEYDITGQGNEGREFRGRDLKCQCEFSEGVGWKVEDGRKFNLDTLSCDAKEMVIQQRHKELRDGYTKRFRDDENPELKDHLEEIVLDLIQRRKAGEFLEATTGAEFYGGYFYLQTLKSVSGTEWDEIWNTAAKLYKQKRIDIDGMVVQGYQEQPPPIWEQYASLELNGYTATAYLPTHSKMQQSWAIQLTNSEGELLEPNLGPRLGHIPFFGPDVDDVDQIQKALQEVLKNAKTALPSERPPLQIAPTSEE